MSNETRPEQQTISGEVMDAKIGDESIANAEIGILSVQTSNLDFNLSTDSTTQIRTGTTAVEPEGQIGSSWNIANPNPSPVLTNYFFQFTVDGTGSGGGFVRVSLVNDTTGQELAGLSVSVPSAGESNSGSVQAMIIEPRPESAGSYQYSIRGQVGAENITAIITQLLWKR
jgi:hypothetical protein